MLVALVPEGCGEGGSPCHGSRHRGIQHPGSPGNVPSWEQTGPADSWDKAGILVVTEVPRLAKAT